MAEQNNGGGGGGNSGNAGGEGGEGNQSGTGEQNTNTEQNTEQNNTNEGGSGGGTGAREGGNNSNNNSGNQELSTDELKAELTRVRQEAAEHRTKHNATKKEKEEFEKLINTLQEALGMKKGANDPEEMQRTIANLQSELKTTRLQNKFGAVAHKLNADEELAWAYLQAKNQLSDIDDDKMESVLEERLNAALTAKPTLKITTTQQPPRNGGDNGNGNGGGNTGNSMNELIRRGAGRG